MEEVEEPSALHEIESNELSFEVEGNSIKEEENSDPEFVDSPPQDEQYNACNSEAKAFEFSNQNSLDGNAEMENELDFEDELQEAKVELSKDDIDEDKNEDEEEQGAIEPEQIQEMSNDCDKDWDSIAKADKEDGEICAEEKVSAGEVGSAEEGEDDGELTDDDDLEEGEVKDSSPTAKTQTKQVCRFFNRGLCTWGMLCRFLHMSVNDHGNYNMFAPSSKSFGGPGNGQMNQRGNMHGGPDFHPPPPPPPPPIPPQQHSAPPPPPPPPVSEPPPVESAWERGLRHAKELIKKSTQRKEMEPDFEEKRLNLSLTKEERELNDGDYDKENENYGKSHHRRQTEPFSRNDEPDDVFDNGEHDARDYWHGGRYENFEVRWNRQDANRNRRPDNRTRNNRFSNEREKPKQWRGTGGNKWREERLNEVQTTRNRADEWRDPWRRSKSPKAGRKSRSRGRSHASYSSVSSHSYSERSSHSSYSYSRSSSRSSFYSSRSPSPNKPSVKRKPSPRRAAVPEPDKAINKSLPYKRKPAPLRRTASRSYSHSRSSRSRHVTRSSSSRSGTRTPSASRSRSYSRSLSMDSVSSASSISRSSGRFAPGKSHVKNQHVPPPKKEVKPPPPPPPAPAPAPPKPKLPPPKPASNSLLLEMQRLKKYDKMRDAQKQMAAGPVPVPKMPPAAPVTKTPPANKPALPKPPAKPVAKPTNVPAPAPQKPPNTEPPATESSKAPQPKPQIKLTLISKAPPPPKVNNPFNKDMEKSKAKTVEKDDKSSNRSSIKRPASPKNESSHKRSTSSRRDELLKQLKAVEDAIARKRAKFS